MRVPAGCRRRASRDKRKSFIPLPEPALSALSFRSLLAALRRGGDHPRHSSGAVENTGLDARACRMGV